MTHELVVALYRCTLIATAATLMVLALRRMVCSALGARAVYRLWLIVPFAMIATLLPAPVRSVAPVAWTFALDMSNAPMTPVAAVVAPAFDPLVVLLCIWAGGVVLAFAIFVLQQRRYVIDLGRLARIDARILRADNNRNSPALIGALRPRIVLPKDFELLYAPRERELVLAHERSHLWRGDAQVNALVVALRCLQWFNPVMHFAAARFRFDQELACDAAVIEKFPEARRCYADVMLKTQLAGQARQELRLPVGCQWPSGHPLKQRILMLKQPLPGMAKTALSLALTVVLVGAGSLAAWAAKPATAQATKPAKAAHFTPASYRKLSRIEYPEKTPVSGYCLVIVTLDLDAKGSSKLAELTTHGNAEHVLCTKWANQSASTILANWSFEPAKQGGKPVASQVIVPLVFTAHANDFFDSSPIPVDALDAIRISAAPASAKATHDASVSEDTSYRKAVPPKYPVDAIKTHQQGEIVLRVMVDADGNPVSAKVEKADPPEAEATFAQASIDAVMQWKFNPAEKDGRKIGGEVRVPFTYSLHEM